MRGHLSLATLAILLGSGCLGDQSGIPPSQGDEAASSHPLFLTTLIDGGRMASEPSLAVAQDGTILVCAPRGIGFGSDVWLSTDGGASFRFVGRDPKSDASLLPTAPVLRSGGGDLGGGDCDVGADAGGRLYLADLWLGGVSIATSTDRGTTWQGVPVTTGVAPNDRPWLAPGAAGEVYLTAAQVQANGAEENGLPMPGAGGIWVARSTDGGATFPQRVLAVGNEARIGLSGNLAHDDGHAYLVYTKEVGEGKLALMLARSGDSGATWAQIVAAEQDFFPGQCLSPLNIFPVVAADGAGGVYVAWALQNPHTERSDLFLAGSPDSGDTWTPPMLVTDRPGTRAFPWLAAKEPGRVGLAWYESNATMLRKAQGAGDCTEETPADAEWHLHYAFASDVFSQVPQFDDVLVQGEPIHTGVLGRPYAELLQTRFLQDGRAAIVYVADREEGQARPMFAVQAPSTP